MGYRSMIAALVNSAITVQIGDLKSSITFQSTTTGTYDPATGTLSGGSVTNITCDCLLTSLSQQDIINHAGFGAGHQRSPQDNYILSTGRKALIPAAQLSGVKIDALDDSVVVDGVQWVVNKVSADPSGALITVILQAVPGVKI